MPQLWHIGDQYTKYCTEPKGESNHLIFWVGERVRIADVFDSNGEIPDWKKIVAEAFNFCFGEVALKYFNSKVMFVEYCKIWQN